MSSGHHGVHATVGDHEEDSGTCLPLPAVCLIHWPAQPHAQTLTHTHQKGSESVYFVPLSSGGSASRQSSAGAVDEASTSPEEEDSASPETFASPVVHSTSPSAQSPAWPAPSSSGVEDWPSESPFEVLQTSPSVTGWQLWHLLCSMEPCVFFPFVVLSFLLCLLLAYQCALRE